jgi:bifunctional DNA-binding transcriptional regulator/antitoxin component of YhaV-PrlF toxin-antitoxin module
MQPPHGPHPIAKNGQVVLPKEVLNAVRLSPGDSVYIVAADDPPGAVLVVPVEIATRWFESGREAERSRQQQD